MFQWETLLSGVIGGVCALAGNWLVIRSSSAAHATAVRKAIDAASTLDARLVEASKNLAELQVSFSNLSNQYFKDIAEIRDKETENRLNIVISNANLIMANIDFLVRKLLPIGRDVKDYLEDNKIEIESYSIPSLEFLQTPNFTLFDRDLTQEIADLSESFQSVKEELKRLEDSVLLDERLELAKDCDRAISEFIDDAGELKDKLRELVGTKNGAKPD